jgi:carbonic anhydrase/acetyltransferase-like protein (isoleucine patch superfamily)
MAIIRSVRGFSPKIHPDVFIAENAVIIGDVEIGQGSSIWYGAVLRGDVSPIRIGAQSNIQDGTVVHGSYEYSQTIIGSRVTIGHSVILHGCQIEDEVLVGMGSVLMDNAVIGAQSLVGAGSLIPEGKIYPGKHLILGRPAVTKRPLTQEEVASLLGSAEHYSLYKSWYEV